MTPAERLQPHITAAYRTWNGRSVSSPLVLGAAFAEAEDFAYAKTEIARLRAVGQRTLAEHDHESKIRCQTLERMIAEYEALQKPPETV